MAPKRSAKGLTATEKALAERASELRSRATPNILLSKPPGRRSSTSKVPAPLLKSDGCDIVKKNVSKKAQKYLFIFPGGISFVPGTKLGTLTGLDTPTPCLHIELPTGRVRLCGTLVYPKNAWLGLKGGGGGKKAVKCQDVFENLVVFSEWSWVGKEGDDPSDLPDHLQHKEGEKETEKRKVAPGSKEVKAPPEAAKSSAEDASPIVLSDDSDQMLRHGDEPKVEEIDSEAPRSQPQRSKRKKTDYSSLFDSEDSGEGSEVEVVQITDQGQKEQESDENDSPWE